MKMQAPESCRGITQDGRFIAVDDTGCIEVEAADAAALACHGFIAVAGPATPVAAPIDEALPDFEAMSRTALFAFLRARDVTVTLPITNDALRAAARRAARTLAKTSSTSN